MSGNMNGMACDWTFRSLGDYPFSYRIVRNFTTAGRSRVVGGFYDPAPGRVTDAFGADIFSITTRPGAIGAADCLSF